jgi:hypothetical protein
MCSSTLHYITLPVPSEAILHNIIYCLCPTVRYIRLKQSSYREVSSVKSQKLKNGGPGFEVRSEAYHTVYCSVDCSSAVAEARLVALAVLTIKIKNHSPANPDQRDHCSRRQRQL